ncbi:MAG: hypothetical protein J7K68_06205 [Candidatus Diapherotrites archaeon]|nr:hypothetical protein [Candidatus Diapherotrites archaeon]
MPLRRVSEEGLKLMRKFHDRMTHSRIRPTDIDHGNIHLLSGEEREKKAKEIIEEYNLPNMSSEQLANAVKNLIERKMPVIKFNIVLEAMDHMDFDELYRSFIGEEPPEQTEEEGEISNVVLRRTLLKMLETQGDEWLSELEHEKAAHDTLKAVGVDLPEPRIEPPHVGVINFRMLNEWAEKAIEEDEILKKMGVPELSFIAEWMRRIKKQKKE